MWASEVSTKITTVLLQRPMGHFNSYCRSVGHFNKTVFNSGPPKLGESQGLGESLRLSPILGESLKPVSYTHLTLPTNREV